MRSFRNYACLLVLAAAVTAPAFGQSFVTFATPTSAYTSGTTVMPIVPPNGSFLAALTDGTQTVSFSSTLVTATVPSGGWATWGAPPNTESATPRVLKTDSPLTSLTLTLSVPSRTFGVEIEPSDFGSYSMTATFFNGATNLGSVTRTITGSAGALLAAASSTTPITSVVITAPSGAQGFAMAQFRYSNNLIGFAAVPALGVTGLCGLGMALLAAGAMLARRQNATI